MNDIAERISSCEAMLQIYFFAPGFPHPLPAL